LDRIPKFFLQNITREILVSIPPPSLSGISGWEIVEIRFEGVLACPFLKA